MFHQPGQTAHHAPAFQRATRVGWARRFLALLMVTSIVSVGLLRDAQADNCDLDPTFGPRGKRTTHFFNSTDRATDVLIQPDGRIVVAGSSMQIGVGEHYSLARYNPNGSFDTSFSGDGKQTTRIGSSRANAVALQADGKIVAAGNGGDGGGGPGNFSDFTLARFKADGNLDPSFSQDGKVVTDLTGNYDEAYAVAVQSDGKVLAAGLAFMDGGHGDFGLARYNSNGTLDNTFDTDGKVTTDIMSGSNDDAYAIAVQPDGKIVLAGISSSIFGPTVFALARYNSNGSLDTTFDNDGKVTTGVVSGGAFSVALQSDGKIVAAGFSGNIGVNSDFCIVRYNPDGSLDTSFNNDGIVTTNFSSPADAAQDVIIQPDNKIVVAGNRVSSVIGSDFALARYNSDGSPDTDFYQGGQVTTDFFFGQDVALGIALQSDGQIIAVGSAQDAHSEDIDFAIVRYFKDSNFEPFLDRLSLTANTAFSCGEIVAFVRLCGVAPPGGTVVELSSTNPAASVPPTVTVEEGQTSAQFVITAQTTTSLKSGTIIARLGKLTRTSPIVVPQVGVSSVTLQPNSVTGPANVTGQVALSCPAPAGGIIVSLSSNNPAIASPTVNSIVIPEGQQVMSFTVRAFDVSAARSAVIKAAANGTSKGRTLVVN